MGISQLSPSFHSFVDVCNHRHSDFIILKIHRLFLRVICENLHEQTPDSSRDDKSQLEVMERREGAYCKNKSAGSDKRELESIFFAFSFFLLFAYQHF